MAPPAAKIQAKQSVVDQIREEVEPLSECRNRAAPSWPKNSIVVNSNRAPESQILAEVSNDIKDGKHPGIELVTVDGRIFVCRTKTSPSIFAATFAPPSTEGDCEAPERNSNANEPSFSLRRNRPEQAQFRSGVAALHGNRCCITGAEDAVEAAHNCGAADYPQHAADKYNGLPHLASIHDVRDEGKLAILPDGRYLLREDFDGERARKVHPDLVDGGRLLVELHPKTAEFLRIDLAENARLEWARKRIDKKAGA